MSLKSDLALDHYVGAPIAFLLNMAARLLGRVLGRNHSLSPNPKRVFFIKFVGLGSVVRAAFLAKALKEQSPGTQITFVTFKPLVPLLKLYPFVDSVIVFRRSVPELAIDLFRFTLDCLRNQPDLVLDLEVHSKFSSIVSTLSMGLNRAGFGGVTSRFRRGLYTHLVFWNPRRSIDRAYETLGRVIGIHAPARLIPPELRSEAQQKVAQLLSESGVPSESRLVGINPHAGDLALERRWPIDHFARMIGALPEGQKLEAIIIGAPSERAYSQELVALLKDSKIPVHNFAGKLSLEETIALMSRFSVMVTNDTGPLHIAGSLQVPLVSLWGPTHPGVYAPPSKKHITLYQSLYCSPCTHASDEPPCFGDNQCLKRIPWQRAFRAVLRTLEIPMVHDHVPAPPTTERPEDVASIGYWKRHTVGN